MKQRIKIFDKPAQTDYLLLLNILTTITIFLARLVNSRNLSREFKLLIVCAFSRVSFFPL
jgi:hypothetical protein